MKKIILLAIVGCICWLSPVSAGELSSFILGGERGFTCKYEEVTTILNEGDLKCAHEWVDEPVNRSALNAIPAMYCSCGCDFGNGGHKICKKCLRKVRTVQSGKPIPLEETEYEKLEKQIQKDRR